MKMPEYLQEHQEDMNALHQVVQSIDVEIVPSQLKQGFIELKADMEQFSQDVIKMTDEQFFSTLDSIKESFLGLSLSISSLTNASA